MDASHTEILHSLLRIVPAAMLKVDNTGLICEIMTDKNHHQALIGKRFTKLINLICKSTGYEIINKYNHCRRKNVSIQSRELSHLDTSGNEYFFDWYFSPLPADQGMHITVKDVTEAVLLKQELYSTAERYRCETQELKCTLSKLELTFMEAANTNKKLNVLYKTSALIQKRLSCSEFFDKILDIIINELGFANAAIFVYDERMNELVCKAQHGKTLNVRIPMGKGIIGHTALKREVIHVVDVEEDTRYLPYHENIGSELAIPLVVEEKFIGVFDIQTFRNQIFSYFDIELLEALANQIAITVKHILHLKDMEQQAITDGLTGLYNYRHFRLILEREFKRSKRYKRKLSLLMFDIDYFKKFNDTYGHVCGDYVLKIVAKLIKNSIRDVDYAVRYGGEEFAVLVTESNSLQAVSTAENIRMALAQYCHNDFTVNDKKLCDVTLSCGVADMTYARSEMELIQNADKALYAAKHNNRDCICVYETLC